MNRFDRFTTEELKVINGALFRIIGEHERENDFNAEEYKIAASLYPICEDLTNEQTDKQTEKILSIIEELKEKKK